MLKKGGIFVEKKLRLICFLVITLILISIPARGYAYIYYQYGYINPYIEIECRTGYSYFDSSLAAWNNAAAEIVYFSEVANSNNSMGDGMYADSWYGLYSADTLQYIWWGRATAFTISLNRRLLVNESDNFWQSVAVHELGHAVCLADNPPETPSIMREDRDRNTLYTPQQDDVDGAFDAYY